MTARELAAILLANPDVPVLIRADDMYRYDITGARPSSERMTPGGTPVVVAIELTADWRDES